MLRFALLGPGNAEVYINPVLVEAAHRHANKVGDVGVAIKLASGAEFLVQGDAYDVVRQISDFIQNGPASQPASGSQTAPAPPRQRSKLVHEM